jgi:hypothetical protein
LAQTGLVAGFDQERPQGFVTRRVQGTDQSCLPGKGGESIKRLSWYPENWYFTADRKLKKRRVQHRWHTERWQSPEKDLAAPRDISVPLLSRSAWQKTHRSRSSFLPGE